MHKLPSIAAGMVNKCLSSWLELYMCAQAIKKRARSISAADDKASVGIGGDLVGKPSLMSGYGTAQLPTKNCYYKIVSRHVVYDEAFI
jgi:hypothetical protein